ITCTFVIPRGEPPCVPCGHRTLRTRSHTVEMRATGHDMSDMRDNLRLVLFLRGRRPPRIGLVTRLSPGVEIELRRRQGHRTPRDGQPIRDSGWPRHRQEGWGPLG